ncbi:MAG: YfhO family protein [bacterium]|nr:YfhO family protein [bacterium]
MIKSQELRKRGQVIIKKTEDTIHKMNYYLLYTMVFAILCMAVFSFFFLNGKSLITRGDGLSQHFNALTYYGEWLREIIKGVVVDHKFEIPMWDLSIGYGVDVITTLHYYVMGDPLDLLAVFVPMRYTEYLYDALIIVRIYLAGLTFSYYAKSHGNRKAATLTGTIAYCFCGYIVMAAARHPYFTNPMIYFPLILLGADRILNKKKPTLFIGMLAVSCISNFYFCFMICVLTVIYVVIRYLSMRKFELRHAIEMMLQFMKYALIGISMAGVLLVPVLNLLLGAHRMGASNHIPLVYPWRYYVQLFANFATTNNDYWTCTGLSVISVIAVILLFMKKDKNKELKIGFIVMTAMLMIPYVGHIMNGLSYVSNRWCWGYAALVSYIVVKMVPELERLTKREVLKVCGAVSGYLVLTMISYISRTERNVVNGVLLLFIVIYLLISIEYKLFKSYMKQFIFGVTAISVFLNAFYTFSLQKGNYIVDYVDQGQAYKKLTTNLASQLVKEQKETPIGRYDQMNTTKIDNTAMQNNLYGTGFYFSLNNGYISQYLDEMYLNIGIEHTYNNLDGRAILDTLASVKHFVIPTNMEKYLPYNYNKKKISSIELEDVSKVDSPTGLPLSADNAGVDGTTGKVTVKSTIYDLYKSSNALPMGYTYDSYISREDYEKLSATDKQEALLQGVVLQDSDLVQTQLELRNTKLPYTIETTGDITVKDGVIQVNDKKATITVKFDGIANSETYLVFDGLRYTSQNPLSLINDQVWDTMTTYEQGEAKIASRGWERVFNYTGSFDVATKEVTKNLICYSYDYNFYTGKSNYLVNMGYNKDKVKKMTITFKNTGKYEFNDMSVVCQPMDKINDQISALKENKLKNVKLKTNSISGKITCDSAKILCMSIPYSEGWTAYVDGQKTEVKQANTMYMAVELEAGEHSIEFRYQTPKILFGCMLSGIGLVLYLGVILYYRKKK